MTDSSQPVRKGGNTLAFALALGIAVALFLLAVVRFIPLVVQAWLTDRATDYHAPQWLQVMGLAQNLFA